MPVEHNKSKPIWVQVLLDRSLSPAAYRVFGYLFWRQGSNGISWPSQDIIAEDLGLTRRSVIKITKQLEKQDYIRVIRPSTQGRGQHLQYIILDQSKRVNAETPLLTKKGERRDPLIDQKRVNAETPLLTKKGGTQRPKKGERRDTLTQRENTKSIGHNSKPQKTSVEKRQLTHSSEDENVIKKKRQIFKSPTSEEVRDYAKTLNYCTLDAEQFVDYYQSKGWMIGKNKMKDWQAAVRTWKRRDEAAGKKTGGPKRGDSDWLPTEAEVDDIMRDSGLIE